MVREKKNDMIYLLPHRIDFKSGYNSKDKIHEMIWNLVFKKS